MAAMFAGWALVGGPLALWLFYRRNQDYLGVAVVVVFCVVMPGAWSVSWAGGAIPQTVVDARVPGPVPAVLIEEPALDVSSWNSFEWITRWVVPGPDTPLPAGPIRTTYFMVWTLVYALGLAAARAAPALAPAATALVALRRVRRRSRPGRGT